MNKPLRVALADDEPLARARLSRLLREAGCEVVQELEDGPSLLQWLDKGQTLDALFLDIQMPGLGGLELMAELSDSAKCPPIVFVTAFSEHAVRAFEAAATDYILKPISAERLEKALTRLRYLRQERQDRKEGAADAKGIVDLHRFPVRAGEGYVFLDLRRITHFEVEDEVVFAWAVSGGKLTRFRTEWSSIAEVEAAFPSADFLRIQRHLLLRFEAILGFRNLEGGRASVRVADEMDLEVSRSMTPRLKERLGL